MVGLGMFLRSFLRSVLRFSISSFNELPILQAAPSLPQGLPSSVTVKWSWFALIESDKWILE